MIQAIKVWFKGNFKMPGINVPNSLIFHFFGLVLLTAVLLTIKNLFVINEFIDNPQFGENEYRNQIMNKIREAPIKYKLFVAFFMVDFLWAAVLLLFLFRVVKSWGSTPTIVARAIAVLAYVFDILENLSYMFEWKSIIIPFGIIVNIKLILYALTFTFFIYFVYKHKIHDRLSVLFEFITSSIFSMLILIIISILMTSLPQGGTIIIDLFYSPPNLLFVYFLLFFLSILISHYPVYFEHLWYTPKDKIDWFMSFKILGFGVIHYRPTNVHDNTITSLPKKVLRHYLGVAIFVAFHFILSYAYEKYFGKFALIQASFLLAYSFSIVIYYSWFFDKGWWQEVIKKGFPYILFITLISMVSLLLVTSVKEWDRLPIILAMASNYFMLNLYMIFRFMRSIRSQKEGSNKIIRIIAPLGESANYLNFLRFVGIFILVVLLAINCFPELSYTFNPLNILLLYIITYYSILTLWLKHILYYNDTVVPRKEADVKFQAYKFLLPSLIIIILLWVGISTTFTNDLHKLPSASTYTDDYPVSLETFLENLPQTTMKGKQIESSFFVGSYGGGLRANVWNMLLLNELQRESHGDFFRSTICFSTVSGGSIGVGSYIAAWSHLKEHNSDILNLTNNIDSIINDVGISNFLGIDIISLLGRDQIRELIPLNIFFGRDRAFHSMRKYAEITGINDQEFLGITFKSFWKQVYNNEGGAFPALIINSTSIAGKQGIAFSLEEPAGLIFSGAEDIIPNDPDNLEHTYFGVLSTSNRFPLFSPTANVPSIGHFLDGGYFDNSGLLSAKSLHDYIATNTELRDQIASPVFVNIINSKEVYIRYLLDEWGISLKKELASGEISAILNTAVSIDKIPNYISEKIRTENNLIEFHMPYKFNYNEAVKVLGGQPDDPFSLIQKIKQNNILVDQALKDYGYRSNDWGIVEPPLARLLSKPALDYHRAMLRHRTIRLNISKLVGKI